MDTSGETKEQFEKWLLDQEVNACTTRAELADELLRLAQIAEKHLDHDPTDEELMQISQRVYFHEHEGKENTAPLHSYGVNETLVAVADPDGGFLETLENSKVMVAGRQAKGGPDGCGNVGGLVDKIESYLPEFDINAFNNAQQTERDKIQEAYDGVTGDDDKALEKRQKLQFLLDAFDDPEKNVAVFEYDSEQRTFDNLVYRNGKFEFLPDEEAIKRGLKGETKEEVSQDLGEAAKAAKSVSDALSTSEDDTVKQLGGPGTKLGDPMFLLRGSIGPLRHALRTGHTGRDEQFGEKDQSLEQMVQRSRFVNPVMNRKYIEVEEAARIQEELQEAGLDQVGKSKLKNPLTPGREMYGIEFISIPDSLSRLSNGKSVGENKDCYKYVHECMGTALAVAAEVIVRDVTPIDQQMAFQQLAKRAQEIADKNGRGQVDIGSAAMISYMGQLQGLSEEQKRNRAYELLVEELGVKGMTPTMLKMFDRAASKEHSANQRRSTEKAMEAFRKEAKKPTVPKRRPNTKTLLQKEMEARIQAAKEHDALEKRKGGNAYVLLTSQQKADLESSNEQIKAAAIAELKVQEEAVQLMEEEFKALTQKLQEAKKLGLKEYTLIAEVQIESLNGIKKNFEKTCEEYQKGKVNKFLYHNRMALTQSAKDTFSRTKEEIEDIEKNLHQNFPALYAATAKVDLNPNIQGADDGIRALEALKQKAAEWKEYAEYIPENPKLMALYDEALNSKEEKLSKEELKELTHLNVGRFLDGLDLAEEYVREQMILFANEAYIYGVQATPSKENEKFSDMGIKLVEAREVLADAKKAKSLSRDDKAQERQQEDIPLAVEASAKFDVDAYLEEQVRKDPKLQHNRTIFEEQYLGKNEDTFKKLSEEQQKLLSQAVIEGLKTGIQEEFVEANKVFNESVKKAEEKLLLERWGHLLDSNEELGNTLNAAQQYAHTGVTEAKPSSKKISEAELKKTAKKEGRNATSSSKPKNLLKKLGFGRKQGKQDISPGAQ